MKKLFTYCLLAIAAFSFNSCGGNDCDADELTTLANKISTAASAYAADQTKANCLAYIAAIDAYVNAADCDEFKSVADDWKAQKASLNCE